MNGCHRETIPVRSIQNYLYCPRLMYFQLVEKVFVENSDTIQGDRVHSNIDAPTHHDKFPEELFDPRKILHRSLYLADSETGLVGVVDLIERIDKESLRLVDYKRGTNRRDANGNLIAKDPDIAQVLLYVFLARRSGLRIDDAAIYYAKERVKIPVDMDEAFLASIPRLIDKVRHVAEGRMPEPLHDDPRCAHCSLYPVCLPDETLVWKKQSSICPANRPPFANNPEGEFIILQDPRAYLSKKGDAFVVSLAGEKISKHPIVRIRGIQLYGSPQFSSQVLKTCLESDIPVAFFSAAGRYLGMLSPLRIHGLDSRAGQYKMASSIRESLGVARKMIAGKINNQRSFFMRNSNASPPDIAKKMVRLRDAALISSSKEDLTGVEGRAAALYFGAFNYMVKNDEFSLSFHGRNRRPPKDPINAMLSLGYSVLCSEIAGVCESIGLDPACGILHVPRYGRPALALDMMEEFRALIVDSVALSLVNRGEVGGGDFIFTSKGCNLNASGRKAFWRAYFRRMNTEATHPQFQYKMTYRGMLEIQARQLWRIFRGDAEEYFPITTR